MRVKNPIFERFVGLRPSFAFSYLYFFKKNITQQVLHLLKYKNVPEIGQLIGQWYGAELGESGYQHQFDCIIPIPLHALKQKWRGYNQSVYFAKGLSQVLQLPVISDAIERTINTTTQTQKNRFDRWDNVKSIFHVVRPKLIEAKRILLVDDVITSGATLEACMQELLRAGSSELSISTLAVAE